MIAEIPEPSYFGHSAAATVRFDVLTSWDTLDGVGLAARTRQAAAKASWRRSRLRASGAPELARRLLLHDVRADEAVEAR